MPCTCEQWLNGTLALSKIMHWTKQRSNTALLKKKVCFYLNRNQKIRLFQSLFSLKQCSKWFSVTGLRSRSCTQVSSRCLLSWQLLFSSFFFFFFLNDWFFLPGNQQPNKGRLFLNILVKCFFPLLKGAHIFPWLSHHARGILPSSSYHIKALLCNLIQFSPLPPLLWFSSCSSWGFQKEMIASGEHLALSLGTFD